MNESRDQHAAQTPSPSTGSRQDTHSVGSATSSASRAARVSTCRPAVHAARNGMEMERMWAPSAFISEG